MAAVTAIRQTKSPVRSTNAETRKAGTGEPVSFHLAFVLGNDYVLPEGSDSVDILRMPLMANEGKHSRENLAGTKMEFWTKKFNTSYLSFYDTNRHDKAWQDRLLVITEKRIFIIPEKAITNEGEQQQECPSPASHCSNKGAKSFGPASMEIVDSIPMEEVLSVTIDMESNPGMWSHEKADSFRHSHLNLHEIERNLQEIERSLWQSRPNVSEEDDSCDPVLRILTKPSKFNRGEPCYFLRGKQDYKSIDADGTAPLRTRADAEALANRISLLAARRHAEHARENRFLRLQKNLRHVWDSVPFNLFVLALIVSNFAFTVLQLENTDPALQTFYENVDLAYTVIFAVGASEPSPTRACKCAPTCCNLEGMRGAEARAHALQIMTARLRSAIETSNALVPPARMTRRDGAARRQSCASTSSRTPSGPSSTVHPAP